MHEWSRIWSLIILFPSIGNIIYGDQANKEVLGHIWLIVGTLNLWNHSVVLLMEIYLLAESTPQHTHNSLTCGEELSQWGRPVGSYLRIMLTISHSTTKQTKGCFGLAKTVFGWPTQVHICPQYPWYVFNHTINQFMPGTLEYIYSIYWEMKPTKI